MSTIAQLATKAIDQDFDSSRQADAEGFVRDAIDKLYRETTLARGDYVPAPVQVNAGDLGVLLPDTGLSIETVYHTDVGQELDLVELDVIAASQQAGGGQARGRPSRYGLTGAGLTTEGLTIVIYPIPDRTYELGVIGRFRPPQAALEAGDQAPIPLGHEKLCWYYARAELFLLEEDDQAMHDTWMAKFDRGAADFRADLQRRSTRNRQVPGTWSGIGAPPRFHHPRGLF